MAAHEDATEGSNDSASPPMPVQRRTRATDVLGADGVPYALHLRWPGDEPGLPNLTTALVRSGRQTVAAVHRHDMKLDLAALAAALGERSAELADSASVADITGFDADHLSPVGMSNDVPVLLDTSVAEEESVLIPSGLGGLLVELTTQDLVNVCRSRAVPLSS